MFPGQEKRRKYIPTRVESKEIESKFVIEDEMTQQNIRRHEYRYFSPIDCNY